MESEKIEKTNFSPGRVLGGLLLGGLVGGVAGLLLAPKAGKELRADLKEKGIEAKKIYDDSVTKAKTIIEDAKNRAGELIKEAERQLSEARMKARDVLSRQETTLSGHRKEEPRA